MAVNEHLYKYALEYYKFGWPMLPLFEYSKNPATGKEYHPVFWENPENKERSIERRDGWVEKRGWWPYTQRKQTSEEIKAWIKNPDLTGIGIITGSISNLTVVDEDNYKKDGKEFLGVSPLIAATVNGGKHHYFKHNADIGTTGYQKGVNVEIKSKGGFLVVPPSLVKNKQGEIGKYSWFRQNIKTIDMLPTLEEADVSTLREEKKYDKTILSELTKAEFGSQHNDLRKFTNTILWRHDPSDWEEFVYPIIRKTAKGFSPPHPEWRVELMIKDCSNFILRKRAEKIAPQSVTEIARQRIKDKELEKDPPLTGFVSLDNLIKGFIQGKLYCLSGVTNAGKTSMASNFAVNVAEQDRKVLYFALEPDVDIVDNLASAQTGKPYLELSEDDLMSINKNIEIYTKDQVPSVDKMIDVIHTLPRYDLIIVDHIGYFVKGDKDVLQEQDNITKKLVSLAKRKKTAIMFIMHMRKKSGGYKRKDDGDKMPTMDELKGSSSFSQDSTDVLFVTRSVGSNGFTQENDGKIVVAKTKRGKNGIVPVYFHEDSAKISEPQNASYDIF